VKIDKANAPFLSVIVPVYNGEKTLAFCLDAIAQSDYSLWELIVVDDGSTDRSAFLAERFPALVVRSAEQQGAAAARNYGAQLARGNYLFFIDADCEVHPDTFSRMVAFLQRHPEADAVFGSYDDAPKPRGFVAQYRNLLHHYVHQTGSEEASTFWTGCGVVKRSMFQKVGGFNPQMRMLEDIDLGYRIRRAGGKICLAKHVQVKHHKEWNLFSMIKTDVLDRGIPWTRMLLSQPSGLVDDLNLQVSSRLSVLAAYTLLLLLASGLLMPKLLLLSLLALAALLQLNWHLYCFFNRKRGGLFSVGAIVLHWIYYLYCGVSFGCGVVLHWLDNRQQKPFVVKSQGEASWRTW